MQAYETKHRAKGNGFGYGLADLDGVSRTLLQRWIGDPNPAEKKGTFFRYITANNVGTTDGE